MSNQSNSPSFKNKAEMVVQVEFTGLGRSMVGERQKTLTLPAGTDYHGLIHQLADLFPGLVGIVIAANHEELLNANLISRNGEELIMPEMLERCPENGDRLTLLSIIVGGSKGK
ncbi:MAG TPA: MoaD/ThiS family protein [Anaerolineaceae bacterium]|jgi:sulfur carrier protein ThiS